MYLGLELSSNSAIFLPFISKKLKNTKKLLKNAYCKKIDFKYFAFFSLRDNQLFITLFCNFHSFSEHLELNKKFIQY